MNPTPLSHLPGGRVLDVASGRGGSIQFLIENLPTYEEIIGIDITAADAKTVAAFEGKAVRFMQMDAAHMDFADASFDAVCIVNSLHHLADLPGALAEMNRVLKPGGYFIIIEMYRDEQAETQLTHVSLHHWWAAVDTARGVCHNETFTHQHLLELVDSLGLQSPAIHTLSDLSEDPKAPDSIQYLNAVIDQYIQRAEGLPNQAALVERGEALRQRVHEIGLHGASALLVTGQKMAET
jgi:ubiquinone/menaquinone biosynthesis C-methylase UbiE